MLLNIVLKHCLVAPLLWDANYSLTRLSQEPGTDSLPCPVRWILWCLWNLNTFKISYLGVIFISLPIHPVSGVSAVLSIRDSPIPPEDTDLHYLDRYSLLSAWRLTNMRGNSQRWHLPGIPRCVIWSSEESTHGHRCPQHLQGGCFKVTGQKDSLKSQCRRVFGLKRYWLHNSEDWKFKAKKKKR